MNTVSGGYALALAGLTVIAIAVALARRRVATTAAAALLAVAGMALALDGVVTGHAAQVALRAAFTVLGGAAVFVIGIGESARGRERADVRVHLPVPLRILLVGAGCAAVIGHISLIGGPAGPLALPGAVALTTYPVLVSVMVLGAALSRLPGAARPDEVTV